MREVGDYVSFVNETLPVVDDEAMRARLGRAKKYTALVIMKAGPEYGAHAPSLIWEHARRNMALQEAGKLCVVCPSADDSAVRGIGLFDADPDEVSALMRDDPAVRAKVLSFDVHPCRGFPGDVLAG